MIVLGSSETKPYGKETREIRKVDINISAVIDTDRVLIQVPGESVMITLDSKRRPGIATIYYETVSDGDWNEERNLPVRAFVCGDSIPEGFHLIGHIWQAETLVAIYVGGAVEKDE